MITPTDRESKIMSRFIETVKRLTPERKEQMLMFCDGYVYGVERQEELQRKEETKE